MDDIEQYCKKIIRSFDVMCSSGEDFDFRWEQGRYVVARDILEMLEKKDNNLPVLTDKEVKEMVFHNTTKDDLKVQRTDVFKNVREQIDKENEVGDAGCVEEECPYCHKMRPILHAPCCDKDKEESHKRSKEILDTIESCCKDEPVYYHVPSSENPCGNCRHRDYDSYHNKHYCEHDPNPKGICGDGTINEWGTCGYWEEY
jgi:hypothetical protein